MTKLKCYYAHTMISYGSTIEQDDIKLLENLGFLVINPNSEIIQSNFETYKQKYGSDSPMEYFKKVIDECDIVIFRALPHGKIPSGIADEVQHALDHHIPVLELPVNTKKRMMSYSETKDYYITLGYYKHK